MKGQEESKYTILYLSIVIQACQVKEVIQSSGLLFYTVFIAVLFFLSWFSKYFVQPLHELISVRIRKVI